jgi:GNAT superfamily N-acetyltransferase
VAKPSSIESIAWAPVPSIVPASRFFAPPTSPFDTEVAVLGASCVTRDDAKVEGLSWIASPDLPETPLWAVLPDRLSIASPDALADHLLTTFRAGIVPGPAERNVLVESKALADRLSASLLRAGLQRSDDLFFGIAAEELASKETRALELEAMVGDEPWRDWGVVERAILEERFPGGVSDALLDRTVEFKRRQQRHSPPIRRFLARDDRGEPIAMIGYAPFGACDLGFASRGVLARLRDVAVVPRARRRGVARALLRAIAERAIGECDATQVLIGAAATSGALGLYRGVGARPIGGFVCFHGDM